MVALNAHFAVLAAFCSLAAVSFAPISVGAAAIQARHPVAGSEKFASTIRGSAASKGGYHHKMDKPKLRKGKQHKARIAGWSPIDSALLLADITLGKRHEDGLIGMEPSQVHFTRRGEDSPKTYARRSSVLISNSRGGVFAVSPAKRSLSPGSNEAINKKYHISSKRDQDRVPGIICIKSGAHDSPAGDNLALAVEEIEPHAYALSASKYPTKMYIVPMESSFGDQASGSPFDIRDQASGSPFDIRDQASGSPPDILVTVQVPVPDSAPGAFPYCATTNVKDGPRPITVEKCFEQTADKVHRRQQDNIPLKKSQMFIYNVDSGVIRPRGYKNGDTASDESRSNSDRPTTNKIEDAGVASILNERDSVGPSEVHNATLVFVPDSKVANVKDISDPSSAAVITATATMTTTVTMNSTPTPSASAADIDPASSGSISTSTEVTSATVSSPTPLASAAAMNVAVVGPDGSTSTVSSSAAATSTTNSAAPTTINAEAIASEIAASNAASTVVPASTTDAPSSTMPTATVADVGSTSDVSSSVSVASTTDLAAPANTVSAEAFTSDIATSGTPSIVASAPTTDVSPSTVTPTAAALSVPTESISNTTSSSSPAPAPVMTPLSAESYQWAFKADRSRL